MPKLCTERHTKRDRVCRYMLICGKCTSEAGCPSAECFDSLVGKVAEELCEVCPKQFRCWTER